MVLEEAGAAFLRVKFCLGSLLPKGRCVFPVCLLLGARTARPSFAAPPDPSTGLDSPLSGEKTDPPKHKATLS